MQPTAAIQNLIARGTKLVATMGPSTSKPDVLRELIVNGRTSKKGPRKPFPKITGINSECGPLQLQPRDAR